MQAPRPSFPKKPLIGLTLDHVPAPERGAEKSAFSRYAHYALRENYMRAIADAGGLPVAIGYDHTTQEDAEALVARLDGLVITGGAFDVEPALYGEEQAPETSPRPARTAAELALLKAALARDIPILGICGGMQLLAVASGGTLIQHMTGHEQPNPRHEPGHAITITPGTRLAAITGARTMHVNSAHHQAVRSPGSAIVSATAPDSTIEAIELPDAHFALGVQWHPEFLIDAGDPLLFTAFIEAAQ